MTDDGKITLRYEWGSKTVTFELRAFELTHDTLLEAMQDFIRDCGYIVDGHLEFMED